MLIKKSRKRQMTEGTELSNQDKTRTLGEKETYKYLGILKADTIKHAEMNKIKKKKKEYLKRTRKLLKAKLYSRNLVKGMSPSLDTRDHFSSGPEKNDKCT